MATYRIECEPCEIYWEVERPMAKPPKKAKCPQCGKMGERCWTAPNLKFVGMDFQTNIAKAERWGKNGMDKDTANEWLDKSIKGSKQNMRTGGQQYKKMFLDRDYAIEKGMVKQVSDKDKAARVGVAKELRKEASKRIKIRDD
jgi:uncharacterized protein (UPF0212 family)